MQLRQWENERKQAGKEMRFFNVVPHSEIHGALLVLRRPDTQRQTYLLDPRGTFVMTSPGTLYLWQVCHSNEQMKLTCALCGTRAFSQGLEVDAVLLPQSSAAKDLLGLSAGPTAVVCICILSCGQHCLRQ